MLHVFHISFDSFVNVKGHYFKHQSIYVLVCIQVIILMYWRNSLSIVFTLVLLKSSVKCILTYCWNLHIDFYFFFCYTPVE